MGYHNNLGLGTVANERGWEGDSEGAIDKVKILRDAKAILAQPGSGQARLNLEATVGYVERNLDAQDYFYNRIALYTRQVNGSR